MAHPVYKNAEGKKITCKAFLRKQVHIEHMELPSVLIIIPTHKDIQSYGQLPEGILRLTKYLESKNIGVDVVVCPVFLKIDDRKGWAFLLENKALKIVDGRMPLQNYSLIALSIVTEELVVAEAQLMNNFLSELRNEAPHTPFAAGGYGVWTAPFQIAGKYKDLDFVINKWGEVPLEFLAKKVHEWQVKHPLTENGLRRLFGVKVFEQNTPKGQILHYIWAGRPGIHIIGKKETPPEGIFTRYVRDGEPAVYATGEWTAVPKEALQFKHERKGMLEITTQLGCGYGQCTFCDWAKSTKYERLSVDWVLESVVNANPRLMVINDACFLFKGARCKESIEILNRIKKLREERRLRNDFSLSYECRADAFSGDECDAILRLMKDAGTKKVNIGFESGSERILREFKKGNVRKGTPIEKKILTEENILAIDAMSKAWLEGVAGYFILSTPDSEITDTIKTLELITYLARMVKHCKVLTNGAVFETSREPLCIDRAGVLGLRILWPSDPLLEIIARYAVVRLNGLTFGYFLKDNLSVLMEVSSLIDTLLDRSFLERLKKEPHLVWKKVEGDYKAKYAGEEDYGEQKERIKKRYKELAEKSWKEYILKGKYDEECKEGVTFAEAAKRENEKLKIMIRTNDRKQLRKIMLG